MRKRPTEPNHRFEKEAPRPFQRAEEMRRVGRQWRRATEGKPVQRAYIDGSINAAKVDQGQMKRREKPKSARRGSNTNTNTNQLDGTKEFLKTGPRGPLAPI